MELVKTHSPEDHCAPLPCPDSAAASIRPCAVFSDSHSSQVRPTKRKRNKLGRGGHPFDRVYSTAGCARTPTDEPLDVLPVVPARRVVQRRTSVAIQVVH